MEAAWVLASVGLLLIGLVSGRWSPSALFVLFAVGYFLLGYVSQEALLASYSNSALVTLLLLLLVSLALERSYLVVGLSRRLIHRSEKLTLLRITLVTAALSAFLSNTAVVGGLLRVVSLQQQHRPSRLLIPLSFAAVLGGITTLVGTSTNLVVNSLTLSADLPEFSIFDFAYVGVPVALLSLLALVWSSRFLPHYDALDSAAKRQQYLLQACVKQGSNLIGKSIEDNQLRGLDGLYLVEIIRQERLLSPVRPEDIIEAGDLLLFSGEVNKVHSLKAFDGLALFDDQGSELLSSNLVEVVISPESDLVHRTIREMDFRTLFDAGVVGISRGNVRLQGQLGRVSLHAGDTLLLAVGQDFYQHNNLERNFYVLSEEPLRPSLTPWQNALVLGGFASVVAGSALGWFSLMQGLLVFLGMLLLGKILKPSELRRRFPFELWLIIGSALTVSQALQNAGASDLLLQSVEYLFAGLGIMGALVGVYLLTWLLTEMVTNTAAAAVAMPLALASAQAFDANYVPFILVVAYAASANFFLPFGYQTHLMVFSPGQYKVTDFAKVGGFVWLVYTLAVLVLVPWVFPF